jgi:hypothetical protein
MITFDQSKIKDDSGKQALTYEAEAIRLSNDLRSKPARSYINWEGIRIDVPAKKGFDIETVDFRILTDWLSNPNIKKSNSLIAFVHRWLEGEKDIERLGKCGFSSNPNTKIIKKKNGEIRILRK